MPVSALREHLDADAFLKVVLHDGTESLMPLTGAEHREKTRRARRAGLLVGRRSSVPP